MGQQESLAKLPRVVRSWPLSQSMHGMQKINSNALHLEEENTVDTNRTRAPGVTGLESEDVTHTHAVCVHSSCDQVQSKTRCPYYVHRVGFEAMPPRYVFIFSYTSMHITFGRCEKQRILSPTCIEALCDCIFALNLCHTAATNMKIVA
eukprot:IDg15064t1